MRVRGRTSTIVNGPQAFSMANRTFTPTADGSFILYGNAIFDRQAHDVPSGKIDPARCDAAIATRQQADQSAAGCGFAGTAFAHQPQDLAGLEGQGNVVDGPQPVSGHEVFDREMADG